ncbi:triphosphoribosyl-dephospho-CoA synthase CitG [[Haemophilus] ducreyi]|uniref:triphosphoribosyl-dephospho-CoA synthase CitG n=1 Tax=Haemophilus ducreyi TaxID=730 RepID=UPI0006563E82|nr:triphosphoribosyl-dephospho-CoA synthase CitG [[Haemophilus] ducreyi]AKO45500.1 2-(5'-triphosphoribosyl)-3'-dephospho CoA synthase [[Haemophilus] ducreyi]AKO46887.1 2-(5'-triphosphoribosyl)-3'-dephospho CoA synthase [[Haemophilus] ducreyi]AKO48227.1 2-(5'-triphosphoribosyl)-3'-dephospho CoA synthase [[Haemophilus] ducreyi]AKO49618.1 2-(5'-triphosphoribosyl)-3'-dephospho CoA synthase [[Haemophilus] ducreyi]OOS04805.1 2-(5'-triphosphoribosyl)-3'-dephospho CoA synthase [[Haemophilus] ducreyi]
MFNKFCKRFSLAGTAVSLEQLLIAREQRVALQQQCLHEYQQTLLSLTLTAVGPVKKNALLDYMFAKALANITVCFNKFSVTATAQFIRPLQTGHEALFVLPIDAKILKRAMIELENSSPLARLWDIDVISQEGHLLSRGEFGFAERTCLMCAESAKICARSRRHSIDDLLSEIHTRAQQYYFAEQIAELAYQALIKEARLTPKPGLVDSTNNGSHQDMSLNTFEQSAIALRPFFTQFVLMGIETANLPDSHILSKIRPLGLQAEQAMFVATNQVNTHKGAIFAFGLVCTALGRHFSQWQNKMMLSPSFEISQDTTGISLISETVARFTQGITDELQNYSKNQPLTAGIALYQQYGFSGARGEAEKGFPLVQQAVAFILSQAENEARWYWALLYLMANNNDTNVVHRGGINGLQFIQDEANKRLENAENLYNASALVASLREFDDDCIARNLSPGGSADLLALTIFFLSLLYY